MSKSTPHLHEIFQTYLNFRGVVAWTFNFLKLAHGAKYIIDAVDIPVICDADTGYGNPINMWRTVSDYEALGAAAIHIEDQVFPKKCGFLAG